MKKIIAVMLALFLCSFSASALNTKIDTGRYDGYHPYRKKLKNKIIATKQITQNGITIKRNTLEPKTKVTRNMAEYEYLITNKTGQDIVINKVVAPRFLSKWGVAGKAVIPSGKDFIPLYGLVLGIQTDVEKNKFIRELPQNQTIKKNGTMRVLAMTRKGENPTATFHFTKGKQKIVIVSK